MHRVATRHTHWLTQNRCATVDADSLRQKVIIRCKRELARCECEYDAVTQPGVSADDRNSARAHLQWAGEATTIGMFREHIDAA